MMIIDQLQAILMLFHSYFNRGLQRLYTGTCIILQKTIKGVSLTASFDHRVKTVNYAGKTFSLHPGVGLFKSWRPAGCVAGKWSCDLRCITDWLEARGRQESSWKGEALPVQFGTNNT